MNQGHCPVTDDFDTSVHYQLVSGLLSEGKIPSNLALAERMAVSVEVIENALRRLADNHGLVLHPHVSEPWVIHPFSVSPSATWVEAGDRGWWAPCMWCACGIATLAGGDATIHTRIGGEREDVDIHVAGGQVIEKNLWVHFAVPPRAAWDNVHHFCATVLSFRHPDDVRAWSERHGISQGAVIPISQVMDLGKAWYGRHADQEWHKWSVREASMIFTKVGLAGEFWELPVSEGGF
jgi:hypothetical protein